MLVHTRTNRVPAGACSTMSAPFALTAGVHDAVVHERAGTGTRVPGVLELALAMRCSLQRHGKARSEDTLQHLDNALFFKGSFYC